MLNEQPQEFSLEAAAVPAISQTFGGVNEAIQQAQIGSELVGRENLSTDEAASSDDDECQFCKAHLKEAFDSIDKDHDGFIGSDELTTFFRDEFRAKVSQPNADLMDVLDNESSNFVSFNKFSKLIKHTHVMEQKSERDDLEELFQMLDVEGCGYITSAELKSCLDNLGESMTEQQVQELVREFSVDDRIYEMEFVAMLQNLDAEPL